MLAAAADFATGLTFLVTDGTGAATVGLLEGGGMVGAFEAADAPLLFVAANAERPMGLGVGIADGIPPNAEGGLGSIVDIGLGVG